VTDAVAEEALELTAHGPVGAEQRERNDRRELHRLLLERHLAEQLVGALQRRGGGSAGRHVGLLSDIPCGTCQSGLERGSLGSVDGVDSNVTPTRGFQASPSRCRDSIWICLAGVIRFGSSADLLIAAASVACDKPMANVTGSRSRDDARRHAFRGQPRSVGPTGRTERRRSRTDRAVGHTTAQALQSWSAGIEYPVNAGLANGRSRRVT
jgi:hypothetical protein